MSRPPTLARPRLNAILLAAFSILALVLAAVGVYGVISYSVARRSLLSGVGATDPLTFAAVPAVLLATAAVASLVPARRASRVDPTVTCATSEGARRLNP